MTPEAAATLRRPFDPEQIGKLPKAGTTLDYVGHAAVTDRLLQADPAWTWEPVAIAPDGAPLVRIEGRNAVLWIRLTVCDVTRLGVGIVAADAFERDKQLISDALRNAAMRFGVALDLWSKEELPGAQEPVDLDLARARALLASRFDAIADTALRRTLKARLVERFGRPDDLDLEDCGVAEAWLDEQLAATLAEEATE